MKGNAMRKLHNKERTQRGCIHCTEVVPPVKEGKRYRERMCPHKQCPYRELDEYEKYEDYLQATKPEIEFMLFVPHEENEE